MSVVCAIPLQVPVHRMRVTVRCRELGTPLHTTVRRMTPYVHGDRELIAAATGLPVAQIARVQGELAREQAPVEREYVVWADHARGRCLPYSALDGVVAVRRRDGGPTPGLEPPMVGELERMGLSAAASWDGGIDGHVEIAQVLDAMTDVRGGSPSGGGVLSHVLCLPDVHLLVRFEEDDPYEPRLTLTQHAIDSPELTNWLHERFDGSLPNATVDLKHLTEARPLPPQWLADLTTRSNAAESIAWEFIEPHPRHVRATITTVTETAVDRLDVCAPDVSRLPEWLRETLTDAQARGVSVVLRPANEGEPPKRLEALLSVLPDQPEALCVIADASAATIHTDPLACLDRSEHRAPQPQHLAFTREQPAVRELLGLLGLTLPQRRKPSEKLGAATVRVMLVQALKELVSELPGGVTATIEPDDERFAAATLDRYHHGGRSTSDGMRAVAAGTAWERAVIATASYLCSSDDLLELLATRWSPAGGGIDLDVILADHTKRIMWVIDAKNTTPTNRQLGTMIHQLRTLRNDSDFLSDGWRAMGVIVHRSDQLRCSPCQTEQRTILRCSLRDFPRLLLADALPDQRVA